MIIVVYEQYVVVGRNWERLKLPCNNPLLFLSKSAKKKKNSVLRTLVISLLYKKFIVIIALINEYRDIL